MRYFYSQKRTFLALGLAKGEIRIFEQKSDNSFVLVPFEMESQHSSVSNIEADHEKSLLFIGRLNGQIQVLDYTNISRIKQIKKTAVKFYSMFEKSFDFKNTSIFGAIDFGQNFSIKEDIKKNKVSIFGEQKNTVYTSVVSKYTETLFTGSFDHSILIRNLHTNKRLKHLKDLHTNYVAVILLLNNDRVMVSAGYDNNIIFYDLESSSLLKSMRVSSMIYSLRWIPEFGCLSFGAQEKTKVELIYIENDSTSVDKEDETKSQ